MTKAEKELLNDEFMKTLKIGLNIASLQADMIEANMKDLDKKMGKLDDDLDGANK